jgi:phage tail tape-measure protein
MRLGNVFKKAKDVYDKRGGSAAAKGDMQELKDIQAGGGTTSEKLKRAAQALKEPGAKGPQR